MKSGPSNRPVIRGLRGRFSGIGQSPAPKRTCLLNPCARVFHSLKLDGAVNRWCESRSRGFSCAEASLPQDTAKETIRMNTSAFNIEFLTLHVQLNSCG